VDDERNVHYSFRRALGEEYEIISAHDGEEALNRISDSCPDIVLLDIRLPRVDGLETLERIHTRWPTLPVIMMTAFGTVDTAIRATALSARDYLLKPIDVPALKRLLLEVLPGGEPIADIPETSPDAPMVGHSPKMQELFKFIGRSAATDSTLLVTGESGTGKEIVSRAVHEHGRRRGGPFIAINCAAIPGALLESELFGHERGAFTGAEVTRVGRFEEADGGTIFLDEIGEMSPDLQVKLLRVLQGREVTRLGGSGSHPFDARVIAATNVDLERRVASGEFREDLYYRLNVLRIDVPPLRERAGDIWLLANHFLERDSTSLGRHVLGFAPECAVVLEAHNWPGNVRELENVVRQASLRARGDRIRPADLQFWGPGISRGENGPSLERVLAAWLEAHDGDAWDGIERRVFETALALRGNNQVQAAKLLGVSRNVLRHRIEKYSL
jgi:DNA-binding NtrC family response regulator